MACVRAARLSNAQAAEVRGHVTPAATRAAPLGVCALAKELTAALIRSRNAVQSHTGETNKRMINKFSRHLADLTIANSFLTTS